MNTNIIDKITPRMNLLKISEYPFTSKELTSSFRTEIMQYHPDKYKGDDAGEKAGLIIDAYNELKNYCEDVKINVNTILEEKGMFDFNKPCEHCEGAGFVLTETRVYDQGYSCTKCNDTGIYKVKCKWCNDGEFTLKNGHKVKCKACKGTGIYELPCNHRISFAEESYNRMFNKFSYRKVRHECRWCNGSGEVKFEPVNPVIPKGAIL